MTQDKRYLPRELYTYSKLKLVRVDEPEKTLSYEDQNDTAKLTSRQQIVTGRLPSFTTGCQGARTNTPPEQIFERPAVKIRARPGV